MSEHILWETINEQKEKIADLEKENRLLGERCNQLLKDKGELTDKIADIKANCDLAIEGRDIKIKELELELTVEKDLHQEETNLHLHAENYIKELEKENAELKRDKEDLIFIRNQRAKCMCEDKENLTKAKELIELFVQWNYGCCKIPDYKDIVKQAEQFLKDIKEG